MLSESSQKLAEELRRIEQILLGAVTTPQLVQSSIDGGELTIADEHGQPVGGVRADSTGAVVVEPDVKPEPPRVPAAPTVEGDANILRVAWSGGWAGDGSADVSFRDESGQLIEVGVEDHSEDVSSAGAQSAVTIEVHAATTPEGLGEPGTVVATMPALDGGNSTVCGPFREAGNYHVALVAVDRFNQRSGLSPVVEATVPLGRVSDELMDAYIRADQAMATADGKSRVVHGADPDAQAPDGGFREGDLWFDTSPEGQNMPHRWDGSKWVSVADGRLADLERRIDNADFGPALDEARAQWLAEAATAASAVAEAKAEELREAIAELDAGGLGDGERAALTETMERLAREAREAAETAAVARARELADGARGEALAAALEADKKISSQVAGLESDLSVVRESADGKSKITWSPSKASGEGNAGDTWFQTSGNRIVGHWRHDGNKWVEMSLDATVIPNLDAGKITSGFIDAARIKAGSISADKLLIGDERNLIPNGDLTAGSAVGWPSIATYQTDDKPDGLPAAVTFPPAAGATDLSGFGSWPVEPGDEVGFEVWVKADKPGSKIYFEVRDQADRHMSRDWTGGVSFSQYPVGGALVPTEWTLWRASTVVPAGVTQMKLAKVYLNHPSGSTADAAVSVAGLRLFRKTGSTYIADGAITTGKISAGAVGTTALAADSVDAGKIQAEAVGAKQLAAQSITADKIATGTITAESGVIGSLDLGKATVGELDGRRIAANTISSEQIAAQAIRGESLEAGAIDGKTITGATVRTSAGFPRVQLDDAGLHSWDETGRKTFHADQNTGAVSIIGEFMSGQADQPRVKIDPDDWASIVDTDENGNPISMNGAGIAIDGSGGRGLSIYHGEYTLNNVPAGGAAVISGPGRQHMRMTDHGHTWIRQFEADSGAKSELYMWPDNASLSLHEAGGDVMSDLRLSPDGTSLHRRGSDGKQRSRVGAMSNSAALAIWDDAETMRSQVGSFADSAGLTIWDSAGTTRSACGVWEDSASLTIWDSAGKPRSQVGAYSNHVLMSRLDSAGKVRSQVGVYDDVAVLALLNSAGETLSRVRVGTDELRLEAKSLYFGSVNADMGHHTYLGTGSNWGIRYYNGNDFFGEIGSPGGAGTTEFGIKSVARHLALVSDKSIVFNSRANDGGFRFVNHLTTGSAPNVRMTDSGWIYRQTSARKYKDNIRRLDTRIDSFDDKLLSLRLVDWDDRANIERWEAYQEYLAEGGDPDEYQHPFEKPRRIPGMIADEVHEAGLGAFVMYDEKGEVESLAYDRLGVALIPVVARQRDRISRLEDQVAGQAERLEALEASLMA